MSHPTTSEVKPSREQITIRAELLWKAKGTPQGQDDQIWLEAERQLAEETHENTANSATSQPAPVALNPLPKSVVEEQMFETRSPKLVPKTAAPRKKPSGR